MGWAYVVAIGIPIALGRLFDDTHPMRVAGIGMLLATLTLFMVARAANNTSVFDAYWSVAPPVVALYFVAVSVDEVPGLRQVLVCGLVFAWALRLTANWARGWPGLVHEDWRYLEMRVNGRPYWVQSLFGLHLFPTFQVWLGCLSLYPALAVGTEGLGLVDGAAIVVTGGAILIEATADEQLRAFNRTKAPGDVCDVGLWAWSRHPNYLGEQLFWWGLWLFALAADPGYWWTVIGPLGMTLMFLLAVDPDAREALRRASPRLGRLLRPHVDAPPPPATPRGVAPARTHQMAVSDGW